MGRHTTFTRISDLTSSTAVDGVGGGTDTQYLAAVFPMVADKLLMAAESGVVGTGGGDWRFSRGAG